MAGLLLFVDEQRTALCFPGSGTLISSGGSPWVSSIAFCGKTVPGCMLSTGENLAHASHSIWVLVPLPSSWVFCKNKQKTVIFGLYKWLCYLAGIQAFVQPLPASHPVVADTDFSCDKTSVHPRSRRLRILIHCFRGKIVTLTTSLSRML